MTRGDSRAHGDGLIGKNYRGVRAVQPKPPMKRQRVRNEMAKHQHFPRALPRVSDTGVVGVDHGVAEVSENPG